MIPDLLVLLVRKVQKAMLALPALKVPEVLSGRRVHKALKVRGDLQVPSDSRARKVHKAHRVLPVRKVQQDFQGGLLLPELQLSPPVPSPRRLSCPVTPGKQQLEGEQIPLGLDPTTWRTLSRPIQQQMVRHSRAGPLR